MYSILNVRMPSNIPQGLKSRSDLAKKTVTSLNNNIEAIKKSGKMYLELEMLDSDNKQVSKLFVNYHGGVIQYRTNKDNNNFTQIVWKENDYYKHHFMFKQQDCIIGVKDDNGTMLGIFHYGPKAIMPILKTTPNGKETTIYYNNYDDVDNFDDRQSNYSQKLNDFSNRLEDILKKREKPIDTSNIDDAVLYNFIENINDNSSAKHKEFKTYFGVIKYFEENRTKIFDNPLELATIAFEEIKENTNNNREIIDLNPDGDRIEVLKEDDLFDIEFYDENNKMLMNGKFTLLRDKNGAPLKEDKYGKVLTSDDDEYKNPKNKLCFDIESKTYYDDMASDTVLFDFKHKISLKDGKYMHNLDMKKYDRNGEFMESVGETILMPKYSIDWLKHRIPKLILNIYKSDLKEYKKYALEQMLAPEDLNFDAIKEISKNK